MDKEALIKIINNAFDGVDAPKEITLHVAEAHDDYDYDNDAEHRKKDFVGNWQDIPAEHLKSCQTALSYVDKVGMRYYLPAYMIWYLRHFGNTDEIEFDHPLYSLDHYPKNETLSKYHIERFSLFTPEQLRACALFVKYCSEDETDFTDAYFAKKKYDRYWQFFN